MTCRHTSPQRGTVALRGSAGVALLLICFVGLATWVRGSQEEASSKEATVKAKLADVSWIQGHWGTEFGENELDEIWSPPVGDCMMASFRWLKGGKIWMYELLTITEEEDTLVLRFKHFSRELHRWEEKDEVLTLALAKLGPNFAAFQNVSDGDPKWFIFHKESPTQLTIQVGKKMEKCPDSMEFKYDKKD